MGFKSEHTPQQRLHTPVALLIIHFPAQADFLQTGI